MRLFDFVDTDGFIYSIPAGGDQGDGRMHRLARRCSGVLGNITPNDLRSGQC